MDYGAWASLPALFYHQAGRLADRNFLWARDADGYKPLTWGETARTISELSRGLRGLGLKPGERVVLLSENRPEWLISDLAIMVAGGITVPAYTTNTAADHHHILADSGARGAIVSTRALAQRLLPAAIESPKCRWIIAMEDLEEGQGGLIDPHAWGQALAAGAAMPDDVADMIGRFARTDTACFIYTSGTGGAPKGVMLSHGAILCNCMGAHALLEELGLEREVFLSFLPLSHAYEHTAGQFFPISIGAEIYYATGIDQLLGNLAEARPTIMTAVPRLYENMYQRIQRGVAKEGGLKKRLFDLAVTLGRKRLSDPGGLSLGERIQDLVVERLVRDKMRARFGGRLKAMVSGGAALSPEIGTFFAALGLPIFQGYGQTESAPIISANPPGRVKMDTVGPPFKGVDVRFAEDGEIDSDGYIKITDRKKDIIVLSGGDNISPARIEGLLTLQPEIHQAMVYGDKRRHLVAILVPDEAALQDTPAAGEAGHGDEAALRAAVSAAVKRVNEGLAPMERLRRFVIAPEPFTVENQMMTPTLKIRRHEIINRYKKELDGLYL
ncbi:MAG: AMP-dependent synthetase/ligase [Kiloniellaceae bacterium]